MDRYQVRVFAYWMRQLCDVGRGILLQYNREVQEDTVDEVLRLAEHVRNK